MIKYLAKAAGLALALAGAAALYPAAARADYPDKTIRLVVPFPAGGSTDIAARLIGDRLSDRLGATVVVENQPGASGLIGASAVARARPDGYTLLVTSNGIHSAAATGTANFDLLTDLVPVSEIVGGTLVLVGSKQAPFETLAEFIEHAKQNEDKVNVAINAALGSAHMVFESFRRAVGIDYQPIYYPGESPSLAALISGEAALGIISGPAARPLIEDGQINAIAVTTGERFAILADVPTVSEAAGIEFGEGYSTVMFVPKGTPDEIVRLLSGEIAEIVGGDDIAERLNDLGLAPIGSAPEEYGAIVSAEFERNKQIIADLREAGLVDE